MIPNILFPLSAMLAVLTTSSMAVTVVAVLAPEAAPAIGVDATRIGVYTAVVYVFATLSGAVTGEVHFADCGYNVTAMPSLEDVKAMDEGETLPEAAQ